MKQYIDNNDEAFNLYSDYEEFEAFNDDISSTDYSDIDDESWDLEADYLDNLHQDDDYQQSIDLIK